MSEQDEDHKRAMEELSRMQDMIVDMLSFVRLVTPVLGVNNYVSLHRKGDMILRYIDGPTELEVNRLARQGK